MNEIDLDTRRIVHDNSVAIARFEGRIRALEEEQIDRKTLVKNMKMAILAAIVGAIFTASTLIEMARAAIGNIGK